MQENTVALQALRQAILLGQDGYKFYGEAAERTADPRGQEMFHFLADDEKLHLRIVQDQYEALSAGKGWVSFPEAMERRPEPDFGELSRAVEGEKTIDLDKPLFPPEREALKKAIGSEASDIDTLLFALQIENESWELYRKAATETADPAGQAMYQYVADQERAHFNILMLNYEHLVSAGGWRGLFGGWKVCQSNL